MDSTGSDMGWRDGQVHGERREYLLTIAQRCLSFGTSGAGWPKQFTLRACQAAGILRSTSGPMSTFKKEVGNNIGCTEKLELQAVH